MRKWLVAPMTFKPLLHVLPGQYYYGSQLGKTADEFSFVVKHITPFGTIKARQKE